MRTPSIETLSWMARVMAANMRCFADEAWENGLTEDEEQALRELADRLEDGTATDADWHEAVEQLDANGCACWIH